MTRTINLASDAWILARRADGTREIIPPCMITDAIDTNPIVEIDSPRADWNGALYEFLIGLLQCAIMPEDGRAWRDLWNGPPKPEYLRRRLYSIEDHFNLGGDGVRFMQDRSIVRDPEVVTWGISKLVLESPGDETLRNNADIFNKRERWEHAAFCLPCAATALYNLQAHAPSGGVGHFVSLRGGGPLTTLIMARDLWRTLWANVLEAPELGVNGKEDPRKIFPWLLDGPPEGKVEAANHPRTHCYWGMPRRIYLDLSNLKEDSCSICGKTTSLVSQILMKNRGFNYADDWVHPLTPHKLAKKVEGKPGEVSLYARAAQVSVGYRHWLGLVEEDEREGQPAQVVARWMDRRPEGEDFRIWAFGYEADKAKILKWVEGTMPIVLAPVKAERKAFSAFTVAAVSIADRGAQCVSDALRIALYDEDRSKDFSWSLLRKSVLDRYWAETEPGFYAVLRRASAASPEVRMETKRLWLEDIKRVAITIFEDNTPFRPARAKWTARAFHMLNRKLSVKDPMTLKIMDPYNVDEVKA